MKLYRYLIKQSTVKIFGEVELFLHAGTAGVMGREKVLFPVGNRTAIPKVIRSSLRNCRLMTGSVPDAHVP